MGVDLVAVSGGPLPLIFWMVVTALFAVGFVQWAARPAPSSPHRWRQIAIGAAAFGVLVALVELALNLWPGNQFDSTGWLSTVMIGIAGAAAGCWVALRLGLRRPADTQQRRVSPALAVVGFWLGAVAGGVIAGLVGVALYAIGLRG